MVRNKLILLAFCWLSLISFGQGTAKLKDGATAVLSHDMTRKYDSLNAQSSWKLERYEVVLGAGPAFFYGEIGEFEKSFKDNFYGLKDRLLLQPSYNVNLNLKYRITQKFYSRVSLTGGMLQASDEIGPNMNRGFRSSISIVEPTLIGEYHIIKNKNYYCNVRMESKDSCKGRVLPYLDFFILAGVGAIGYSVKGNDQLLVQMKSQDLNSVGYSSILLTGFGINLKYSNNLKLGIELAGKFPFTDYLDGYSSMFSPANDKYFTLNLTVAYKLKPQPRKTAPNKETLPTIGSIKE